MRRGMLFVVLAAGLCLVFGLSASSAQKMADLSGGGRHAVTRAMVGVAADPYVGPGYGGIGPIRGMPVQFVGVTTQKFPIGAGALGLSRACNAEHPVSRLCEWAEIFRSLPPISLDSDVLVAPNYETNPVPACLNPNGGLNCRSLAQRMPAACCGFLIPTAGPLASLTLSPDGAQSLLACTDTFVFTVTALDVQGAPLAGIQVAFGIIRGTQSINGTFAPTFGITDTNGMVSSTLSLDPSICNANCVGGLDCSATVQAHDLSGAIQSNLVALVDQIP